MPKIVDHELRKAEITKAVLKSIGKNGLANTTIRGIVREGGFSSGTLAHYFSNKDDLIDFAFQAVAEDTYARIEKRAALCTCAVDKVRVVIEELVPSPEGEIDSIISLSFWSAVPYDAKLKSKFHEVYEATRRQIREYISEGVANKEIKLQGELEDEVDFIVAISDGLLVSFLLDPARFPDEKHARLITAAVSRLK
ncbi:transcriptional regulator [Pseudomonas sp. GM49]|uniref:TetR/AcrR family transcriptional regulator n=1 Tax=Pseudomonas sp. GM49 TaxID=1144331 RepID=UPI000270C0BC|nr:TetR/AcrR family transcriptional regulator [Pseudomonas sp. GM49]EJM70001.1 transcriptional regulator [Pseudomonas sp. GM49]